MEGGPNHDSRSNRTILEKGNGTEGSEGTKGIDPAKQEEKAQKSPEALQEKGTENEE